MNPPTVFLTHAEIARRSGTSQPRVARVLEAAGIAPDGVLRGGRFEAQLFNADRLPSIEQLLSETAGRTLETLTPVV